MQNRATILAEIIGLMATHGQCDILAQALHSAMLGKVLDADAALSVFYEVSYGTTATATN